VKFRPETLGFRVLLKPEVLKETKSGIVIASSDRNQAINSDKGEIVGIGPDAWKAFKMDQPPFKVGDTVFYARYGVKLLKDEDSDDLYVIANDEDILVGYTNE
jgi:co-chaperonin GroES (HSP10)